MKHGLLAVKYSRNFARQAIPRMGHIRRSLFVLRTIEGGGKDKEGGSVSRWNNAEYDFRGDMDRGDFLINSINFAECYVQPLWRMFANEITPVLVNYIVKIKT